MDDESGELMELMEEVPLKELGEAELERLVRGWGGKPGIDSRDEGKHTGRNDLLFVEKMMWMDERVWPKGICLWSYDRMVLYKSVYYYYKDEEQVLRGGWTVMRLCRYEGWVAVRTLLVSVFNALSYLQPWDIRTACHKEIYRCTIKKESFPCLHKKKFKDFSWCWPILKLCHWKIKLYKLSEPRKTHPNNNNNITTHN